MRTTFDAEVEEDDGKDQQRDRAGKDLEDHLEQQQQQEDGGTRGCGDGLGVGTGEREMNASSEVGKRTTTQHNNVALGNSETDLVWSLVPHSFIPPSFIDLSFIHLSFIDLSFIDPSFIDPSFIHLSFIDSTLIRGLISVWEA